MKNITKSDDGYYHVKGHKYELLIGSRAQVWHGTAYKTSGGLCKHHLVKNKHGRVVSKSKFESAKKEKRLLKHGYGFTKKKFVLQRKHSKKHRGGGDEDEEEEEQKGGSYGFSSGSNIAETAVKWDSKNWGNNQSPGNLQLEVTNYSGGRSRRHKKHRKGSRRMRGGIYSQSSVGVAQNVEDWNSKIYGPNKGPDLQLYATSIGGRRRKGSRRRSKKRGGYFNPSNISAQDAAPVGSSMSSVSTASNSSGVQGHSSSNSAFKASATSSHQ
jgi:DVNP family